jgi:hypothetical protein
MKRLCSVSAISIFWVVLGVAQAQDLQKIKDGDKLVYVLADYSAKGREVGLEASRDLNALFTEKDAQYMLKSELSTTTYNRKNHVIVTRETPQGGKTDFSPEQQFNWMPPQGDFSKPWSVSFVTTHPQCGNGKVSHDAVAKPIKFTLLVSGKSVEVSAFDISFVGKWDFNNHCRSGKQLERIVYSPVLDILLERDQQNYNAQGFLNRGNNAKLKAVN